MPLPVLVADWHCMLSLMCFLHPFAGLVAHFCPARLAVSLIPSAQAAAMTAAAAGALVTNATSVNYFDESNQVAHTFFLPLSLLYLSQTTDKQPPQHSTRMLPSHTPFHIHVTHCGTLAYYPSLNFTHQRKKAMAHVFVSLLFVFLACCTYDSWAGHSPQTYHCLWGHGTNSWALYQLFLNYC